MPVVHPYNKNKFITLYELFNPTGEKQFKFSYKGETLLYHCYELKPGYYSFFIQEISSKDTYFFCRRINKQSVTVSRTFFGKQMIATLWYREIFNVQQLQPDHTPFGNIFFEQILAQPIPLNT